MSRGLAAAGLAALLAAGAFCLALARALELEPLPVAATAQPEAPVAALARAAPARPEILAAAVDADPFSPERRRPAEPFRLPGEEIAAPEVTEPASGLVTPSPETVELIGTVVAPGGRSFAMCQLGSETPRIVRVGETIGDLTLRSVEPGRAVFVSRSGARIEVRVKKAGT